MRFIVLTSAQHLFSLNIGPNVSDAQALGGILRSDEVKLPTSYSVAFSEWTPYPTIGSVEIVDGRPEAVFDRRHIPLCSECGNDHIPARPCA